MNIKLKSRSGIAIQYDGTNIQKIADIFNLDYKEYKCVTLWNGKFYPDVRITDNNYIDKDLIAGDWVYASHNSDLVEIISEEEFEKYWEKDDER